jgi:amino acid transporter
MTVSGSKGGFVKTMKAVLWSFFGVRRGRDHEADIAQLNPLHAIAAALIAAAAFIGVLIVIVHLVVR